MIGLGRKSIAQKIYEGLESIEDQEGTWLVIYDFKSKPNPRFWGNLRRIKGWAGDGELIQYSVYRAESRRSALTAVKVAEYYGADVVLFRGELVEVGQ